MALIPITNNITSFKMYVPSFDGKIYSVKTLHTALQMLNQSLDINDSANIVIKRKKGQPIYLGICIYYGFNIVSKLEFEERVVLNLKKEKDIDKNLQPKKYSLFIKLPRTGKNGKRIYVYKLRTMQPYSEYLQDYIVKINGLNSDGTIKDDFRITKIGKFLRRYWLDELPMIINWIKGDLKLIGVRPLSDSMLNTYPKEYVKERKQFKPGLIPPYYIDQPKTFDELIESEKRYLQKYKKYGWKTDLSYFLKFLQLFLFKGIRSS